MITLVGGPAEAHTAVQEAPAPVEPAPETAPVEAVWGCPMCETIRQADPGICSICRMDLVLIGPGTGDDKPSFRTLL